MQILWGRAEELARTQAHREQYDLVVSRAMASCSMLFELGVPFLHEGGELIAMKGRNFNPEAERVQSAAEALQLSILDAVSYEIEDEPKTLIRVRRTGSLSEKYPRRFAKIKREPL
jgi:16S rRNA (guanine527-N7)-methyltransferase